MNRTGVFLFILCFWVLSCNKDTTNYTINLPDDNTVISILKSKGWNLGSITYSQSIDVKCDDNYTNSPKINSCQTNVFLKLNSDYTYTNEHGGLICILPVSKESGSWSYSEGVLCIGSSFYNLIQINKNGFVFLKSSDSHYDCHSQSSIYHTTTYTYY